MASLAQVSEIPGSLRWPAIHASDLRGSFSKVLSAPIRSTMGYDLEVREIFWTSSKSGVIRGMHLQVPPHEGAKVVWVTIGTIRDVVLDLRSSSPTYGKYCVFEMSSSSGLLFIPVGCAHGYEVLSAEAVVNYAQECDYESSSDSGIRWNSFGCEWLTKDPIVSERDAALPSLGEFLTPFA
jgi:dTDP-4-dehydrorhamnose 3,5-epimerase